MTMSSSAASSSSPTAAAAAAKTAPRVAIIGSGAAGLAAARVFSRQKNDNNSNKYDVTVLERDADIAGVWNYKPASAVTPMYQGLRTNLPKEIMAYREFPWPSQPHSFVTHPEVKQYLQDYRDRFQLQKLIRTGCEVTQLTCLPDTRSQLSPDSEDWPQIQLEWSDSTSKQAPQQQQKQQQSAIFDAVLVCNGHYNRPACPPLPGLEEYFLRGENKTVLHSIAYDTPERFAGQTVLCIGGRASGSDLAREIAPVARHVYLSDTTCGAVTTQHNVTWVPTTTAVLEDGRVAFEGDGAVEPVAGIDTIIFCSGYDYDFPFINGAESSSSNLELETAGRRVRPLYEQLWHAAHPNVAFVGLPHSVVPFPLFEFQAEAVERSWRRRKKKSKNENDDTAFALPPRRDRLVAAERDAQSGGEGKENGRVPEDTHFLGPRQWDYCRRMAHYGGVDTKEVLDFIATQEAIYNDAGEARKGEFPAGPDTYRSLCYKRLDERHAFERWMLGEKSEAAAAVVEKS